MAAVTKGDSGVVGTPSARTSVFAAGMPAATTTGDYGVATNTTARPDVCNPTSTLFTNPPSASSDLGSA